MDSRDRQELVRDVTRKLASSKAAVKAFAQAMASAEKDRFTLKEAHRLAQNQVTELKRMNERLKRENELLVQQNGSLQDQITYVETQASQQMADLKVRQDEYQHTIAVLRKQIRSSESSVSMALYQQAVAETRATKTELQETKNQIQQLELKMKEQYNRAMQEKDRVLKEYRARTAMTQGKEGLLNNHRQRVAALQHEEKLRQQGKELSTQEGHGRQQQQQEMLNGASQRHTRETPPSPRMKVITSQNASKGVDEGRSIGKVIAGRNDSPSATRANLTPRRSPPTFASPHGEAPSSAQSSRSIDPPASKSAFVPAIPPPPPRIVTPPTASFSTPESIMRPQTPSGLSLAPQQPASKENTPPPPPPVSHAAQATTQRAYNRLNAITAAGGRNSVREKLKTIRRSPLGNATNSTRGVTF